MTSAPLTGMALILACDIDNMRYVLRYISPVLAFGTERRYLTIRFCYRLQIELKLLLASKEEILILKFIKVKTTFTTVKVFTLNKK